MAVKISELSTLTQITSDDFLPIVDSGSLTTKRASAQQVLDYVTGSTFNSLTVTTLTGSTVTGTLALFTTVSASKAQISGNLVIYGSASLAEYPDYAYVLYTASLDKIAVYPGLYVSGNLTGSGLGAFQTVSASTYLGLPTSSGGTPGGTNTTIQFNSGSTFSGSSNLIWDYTNNRLGIGTTTPSYSLDVNGAGAFKDYLLIEASSGTGNDSLLIFNARTNGNSNTNVARFVADAVNDTTDAIFKLQMIDADGGGWDDGFVFKASPGGDDYTYTGLGTTSPTARLDVVGNNTTAARFSSGSVIISGNLTVTGSSNFATISGTTVQFDTISSSYGLIQGDLRVLGTASIAQLNTLNQTSLVIGDKYITILSGGVDHPTLDGSGILWGSGSTGPTVNELGANAHVRFRGTQDVLEIFPGLYVNGNASVSGNLVVTGSITELSTRKIKTNIASLSNQLNTVSKLNPVSYVRLDDGRKEYGFISEEVKEVYPEFVVGEGINYPKMVSVLVSAVKELTDKVEKQQNEIQILKGKL